MRSKGDVAVVGGSAAGLYSACLLARSGARVCVYEAAEQIAPAARTLIVTEEMLELVGPIAERAVTNRIRRFELFADGKFASVGLSTPDLVVECGALVRALAERAQDFGAEIVLGTRFVGLEPSPDGARLHFESARDRRRQVVRTPTLIGADGAFSRVALASGWPSLQTAPLAQAVVCRPADLPPETVRVWFIPEETPYFYWLIPQSETEAVAGLIGETGRDTRICLERFLRKHDLCPLQYQAAKIPVFTRWVPVHRRLENADVYLVGDACAHVKVTTVGGIVTGFKGALAVAEAISTGSKRRLHGLRRELYAHLMVRLALHRFSCDDYRALFDLLSRRALATLSNYSRDQAAQLLFELCRSEPKLLLAGLRHLLPKLARFRSELGTSFG